MRVIVTGGAGFIGSNLVRQLIQVHDCEVLVLDNLTYAGNLESLKDLSGNPHLKIEVADIADSDIVTSLVRDFRPTGIMHLAAESHVDRSIDGPDTFIQTNIVGTFRLLEVARSYFATLDENAKKSFRFLHVSTDEVYGSLSESDPAFTEENRYDPRSPYSASKAASDHLVRAWHETYGLPTLITNCSNNYGPHQFPEKLIPVVILNAVQGKTIPVYGKGDNIRDWLYVTDHCEALIQVLQSGRIGETYNIGGNNEQTNLNLVKQICKILDEIQPPVENETAQTNCKGLKSYKELITFVTDRPGHDHRYAINAARITQELGWAPTEDFQSGFEKTVRWYLNNEEWWRSILNGNYQLARQGLNS